MAVLVSSPQCPASLPPLPLYRFSVHQYHRLADEGILSPEDPDELLEGLIVIKGNSTLVPAVCAAPNNGQEVSKFPLPVRRFTIQQFRQMIRTGILSEDEPVELVEGWILRKMPHNPPHDSAIFKTQKRLWKILPPDWLCRTQSAIATDTGLPEPDLAVARGPEERYDREHPGPRDIGLLVEVSDTTLQQDRELKGPSYARVGVPVYWIVNIPEARIEVYTDPSGAVPEPHYRSRHDYLLTDSVPVILDGKEIGQLPVREILPS
jgi:Uma2 family endonuclease